MNSKLLILALSALAVVSCQTDSSSGPDSSLVRINASFGEFIANTSSIVGKEGVFKANDVITVSAGSQSAVNYMLDGAGEWMSKGGASLKWESKTMDFSAVYPSTATVSNFILPTDQSTVDKIAKADYMTFSKSCTQSGDSPVSINLSRKTARVIVRIDGFETPYTVGSKVSDVKIYSPKSGYKNSSADGAVTPITPCPGGIPGGIVGSTYTTLVIPTGSATPSTPFIELVDQDGVKLTLLKLEIPSFTAGYSYTYGLTIMRYSVVISSVKVEPWTDGTLPAASTDFSSIEFVNIKKGSFMMGSPDEGSDPLGEDDERPQHSVTLTKDFYMSKYEITNAQYCLFLNACGIQDNGIWNLGGDVLYKGQLLIWDSKTASSDLGSGVNWDLTNSKWIPAPGKANFPVIKVTWFGAKAFANWLGGDLPTEAQWEYACRAGTKTPWVSGDTDTGLDNYAWYGLPDEEGSTHAVGTKSANAWGLYDMHGNVWEWCNDWYNSSYYQIVKDGCTDPKGSIAPLENRVMRGGSFKNEARDCRSAYRSSTVPGVADLSIGFRVVVSFLP